MSAPIPDRLRGIRAKIERAKHHVRDLEGRVRAFRETDPYRILCEQDTQTRERVFRVQVRVQPPIELSVIAGEAIQHLRTSLDYLAWQLVEAYGGTPDRYTAFPLYKAPPQKMAHLERIIEGMSPDAANLVKAVQPYQSGYASLGILSELNNFDKHCLLLVVGYGFWQFRMSYTHPALRTPEGQAWLQSVLPQKTMSFVSTPPPRSIMFQDGTEVMRMKWEGGPPVQPDEEFDSPFEVAFAKPEIVQGQSVVPLLTQLSQFIENIADRFTRFL